MDYLEETRLESALDLTFDVEHGGNTYTYDGFRFLWGTGDHEDKYPVVVAVYAREAEQRDDAQPINDLLEVDEKPNTVEVDRHEVSRVTDRIQLTLETDGGYDDNGVPAHVKVQQCGMDLWRQFRFGLGLNSQGANGESPMTFRVGSPPDGPSREHNNIRHRFTIEADYHLVNTETVDAVEDAKTDTSVQ